MPHVCVGVRFHIGSTSVAVYDVLGRGKHLACSSPRRQRAPSVEQLTAAFRHDPRGGGARGRRFFVRRTLLRAHATRPDGRRGRPELRRCAPAGTATPRPGERTGGRRPPPDGVPRGAGRLRRGAEALRRKMRARPAPRDATAMLRGAQRSRGVRRQMPRDRTTPAPGATSASACTVECGGWCRATAAGTLRPPAPTSPRVGRASLSTEAEPRTRARGTHPATIVLTRRLRRRRGRRVAARCASRRAAPTSACRCRRRRPRRRIGLPLTERGTPSPSRCGTGCTAPTPARARLAPSRSSSLSLTDAVVGCGAACTHVDATPSDWAHLAGDARWRHLALVLVKGGAASEGTERLELTTYVDGVLQGSATPVFSNGTLDGVSLDARHDGEFRERRRGGVGGRLRRAARVRDGDLDGAHQGARERRGRRRVGGGETFDAGAACTASADGAGGACTAQDADSCACTCAEGRFGPDCASVCPGGEGALACSGYYGDTATTGRAARGGAPADNGHGGLACEAGLHGRRRRDALQWPLHGSCTANAVETFDNGNLHGWTATNVHTGRTTCHNHLRLVWLDPREVMRFLGEGAVLSKTYTAPPGYAAEAPR